jgi:molecular chaperone GrpE
MTTECRLGAADETIADPETPVRVPAESLDACQAELADVKDRLLRALADQENSRRRAERRSITGQGLLAGVAATERALRDVFVKHGIQKIRPAPGEPFDPHRHQALFEVEGGDYPAGTVAEILLPGYAYHERLLRPALVGVAKSRAAQAPGRSE